MDGNGDIGTVKGPFIGLSVGKKFYDRTVIYWRTGYCLGFSAIEILVDVVLPIIEPELI
jgi:hypothetical protein